MREGSADRRRRGITRRLPRNAGSYFVRELAELALLIAVLAVIGSFVEMSVWVLVGLPIAKAITSAGFYALFLRRVFRRPARTGVERLTGRTAKVSTALCPAGQVKVEGEIWSARSHDGSTIAPHDDVEIVGVCGNTLLVSRAGDPSRFGGGAAACWNSGEPR